MKAGSLTPKPVQIADTPLAELRPAAPHPCPALALRARSMTDAEAPQQLLHPRRSWPHRYMVASIAFLYLLFLGAAVWMLTFIHSYEVKREQMPRNDAGQAGGSLQALSEAGKVEKPSVVFLTPASDEVKNKTMHWRSSVAGTYDKVQRAFIVPQNGSYLLGVSLVLHCDGKCPGGSLHLTFSSSTGSHETCRRTLEKEPPSCIHMLHLPADKRLLVRMVVEVQDGPEKTKDSWRLDVSHSKWWIFMTDK